MSEHFGYRIVLGGHEDFGVDYPSHTWNVTDDNLYLDFSLYPTGKIPEGHLKKYTYIEEIFKDCEEAATDIIIMSPDDNPDKARREVLQWLNDYILGRLPSKLGWRRKAEMKKRRSPGGSCPRCDHER